MTATRAIAPPTKLGKPVRWLVTVVVLGGGGGAGSARGSCGRDICVRAPRGSESAVDILAVSDSLVDHR